MFSAPVSLQRSPSKRPLSDTSSPDSKDSGNSPRKKSRHGIDDESSLFTTNEAAKVQTLQDDNADSRIEDIQQVHHVPEIYYFHPGPGVKMPQDDNADSRIEDAQQVHHVPEIYYFHPEPETQMTHVITKGSIEPEIQTTQVIIKDSIEPETQMTHVITKGSIEPEIQTTQVIIKDSIEPEIQMTQVVNETEKLNTSTENTQGLKRKFTDKDTEIQHEAAVSTIQRIHTKKYTAEQKQTTLIKIAKMIWQTAVTKQHTEDQKKERKERKGKKEEREVAASTIKKAFREHQKYLDMNFPKNPPYGYKKTVYENGKVKKPYHISKERSFILPPLILDGNAGRTFQEQYKGKEGEGEECLGLTLTPRALKRGDALAGTPDEIIQAINTMLAGKEDIRNLFQPNFQVESNLLLTIDRGPTLAQLKKAGVKFTFGDFKELFEFMELCHSNGIFHLDLKPENITRDRKGKLWIIDLEKVVVNGKIPECSGTPAHQPKQLFAALHHDAFHENEILNKMAEKKILNKGKLCFEDRLYDKTDPFIIALLKEYLYIDHGLYDALTPIFTKAEFLSTLTGPAFDDIDLIVNYHIIEICKRMEIKPSDFVNDKIPDKLLDREKVKESLGKYKYFNEEKFAELTTTFTIDDFLEIFDDPAYKDLIGPAENYTQLSDEFATISSVMTLVDIYKPNHEYRGIKMNPHIQDGIDKNVKGDYNKQKIIDLIRNPLCYDLVYRPDRVKLRPDMFIS